MKVFKDIFNVANSNDSDTGIVFLVLGGFLLVMVTILIIKKITGKL